MNTIDETMIPENAFKNLSEEADKIITASVGKASAIAAIPVPVLDIAAVIFIQVKMVEKLASLYNIETENKSKLFLSSTISAIISKLISEALISLTQDSSLDKLLGESLVKASITGFVTTITGEVFISLFMNGSTIEELTPDTYFDYFQEQLSSDRISVENITSGIIDNTMAKFGLN